ncbi:MAG: penicillin-binding protein activator [Alphaproteobacteria bacterium]|nr:penicillin-binding protein activator [Alphaproteobacteria bacterium]
MFNKKISLLFALCSLLFITGCGDLTRHVQRPAAEWGTEFVAPVATGTPSNMAPAFFPEPVIPAAPYCPEEYEYCPAPEYVPIIATPIHRDVRNVSVLLPLSGPHAATGIGIKHAIEIAYIQKQPPNIRINFYDLSSPQSEREWTIQSVISRNPDMILGPLFNDDVAMLRRFNAGRIPALTFTSDRTVLGDGVFSMALLPAQSVESIIRHAANSNMQNIAILAPDTPVGRMLATIALESATQMNVNVASLHYYTENNTADHRNLAQRVALHAPRSSASLRAREILSDVLIRHNLTHSERENITNQLEVLNRTDTVGRVPFDAVVFLGNAADSRSLAAFLRYYDVPARSVRFLGTAMWDTDGMLRDVTMSGAEFAALPPISPEFVQIYNDLHGITPTRMNSMGYDAAMLSIGALSGTQNIATHILSPSGYMGLDGIIRLRPDGTNERALQIMRLNASGRANVRTRAATNFIAPLYTAQSPSRRININSFDSAVGFNAMDFINLPALIAPQYTSRTFHLTGAVERAPVIIYEYETDDDEPEVIEAEGWTPVAADAVAVQLVGETTVTIRQ